jgi:TrpR-related protein YerC/YecD
VATDWQTPDADALIAALLLLDTPEQARRFLRDLCTIGELHDMAQRWAVVRLLDAGMHYAEISRRTGASTATITRIASWLNHGEGGYQMMLETWRSAQTSLPYPEGNEA